MSQSEIEDPLEDMSFEQLDLQILAALRRDDPVRLMMLAGMYFVSKKACREVI